MTPDAAAAARADFDRMLDAMTPYGAGSYLNFGERPSPISTFFPPEVVARLRAVKSHWDPDGLIVAGHPVA